MAYIQVLGGLALLVFAGEFLVRGSVSLAQRFGVPPLIIGLTIVAFGTSAPELLVGIDSVLIGAPTLALGNVIGSNIANIWLVLGLPAIIAPLMCGSPKTISNIVFMLLISGLFIIFGYMGGFAMFEGVIFLILLAGFLYHSSKSRQAEGGCNDQDILVDELGDVAKNPDGYFLATVLVIGGLVGLAYGAHLLVTGSVTIARGLGVSEAVIGLTLVALGTSIPELVTAIIASLKGHCDVALGNVVGSNIFNILAIIGVSSQFGTIPMPDDILSFDVWVMLAASLTLLPFALMKTKINRIAGIVFCTLYVSYMFIVAQGITSGSAVMVQ